MPSDFPELASQSVSECDLKEKMKYFSKVTNSIWIYFVNHNVLLPFHFPTQQINPELEKKTKRPITYCVKFLRELKWYLKNVSRL